MLWTIELLTLCTSSLLAMCSPLWMFSMLMMRTKSTCRSW